MSDKLKNIVTNIIGLLLLGLNIYMFYFDEVELTSFCMILCISLIPILLGLNVYMFYFDEVELTSFCVILCISLALFLFKGSKTKEWLSKGLSKIISK